MDKATWNIHDESDMSVVSGHRRFGKDHVQLCVTVYCSLKTMWKQKARQAVYTIYTACNIGAWLAKTGHMGTCHGIITSVDESTAACQTHVYFWPLRVAVHPSNHIKAIDCGSGLAVCIHTDAHSSGCWSAARVKWWPSQHALSCKIE